MKYTLHSNVQMRIVALAFAVGSAFSILSLTPSTAFAYANADANADVVTVSPSAPAAGPQPTPTHAAGDMIKGEETLAKFKAAWEAARLVNYFMRVTGTGTFAATTPTYESTVKMSRAQVGGWKLTLNGKATGGTDPAAVTEYEIAYDGATARAARHSEKVVFEREIRESPDLLSFFNAQGARQAIAWELIQSEKPFDGATNVAHQGTREIDGVSCDVLFIPTIAAAVDGDEADEGKANPKANAKATTTPSRGVRLFLASTDSMPRRIERVEVSVDGKESARVADISAWALNERASAGAYAMSVPDGYRVRVQKSARPKRVEPAGGGGQGALLAVGDPAPDFTLKDPTGKEHTLASFKGKIILIDFWATWCQPCIAIMPAMDRIHNAYKDKGLTLIGVHVWANPSAPEPVKFFKDKGHKYLLLLEGDPAATAYKVGGIPTFYIIGPDGKIRFRASGGGPGIEAIIKKKIDEILAEPDQN